MVKLCPLIFAAIVSAKHTPIQAEGLKEQVSEEMLQKKIAERLRKTKKAAAKKAAVEKAEDEEQDSWEELKVEEVFEHVPGFNLKKGDAKIYLGKPFSSGTYGQISKAYLEKQPGTDIEIGVAKEFYKGPYLEPELEYLEPELDPENIKVRNESFAAKVLAIIKTVSNLPSQKDFHDKILLMEAYDSDLQIRDIECVKLPLKNANMLWMQLSKSLSHLHSRGYTHNDIKPGNILRSANNEKFVFTDFGLMTPRTDAGVVTDILNLLRVFWCVQSQDVYFFDEQLFPDDQFVDRIKVWEANKWGKPIMLASHKWRDWLDLYCTSESPKVFNLEEQCNVITLKLGKFLGKVQKVYDSQALDLSNEIPRVSVKQLVAEFEEKRRK